MDSGCIYHYTVCLSLIKGLNVRDVVRDAISG